MPAPRFPQAAGGPAQQSAHNQSLRQHKSHDVAKAKFELVTSLVPRIATLNTLYQGCIIDTTLISDELFRVTLLNTHELAPAKLGRSRDEAIGMSLPPPCRGCGHTFRHLGRHLGHASAEACRAKYYSSYDSEEEGLLPLHEDVLQAKGTWDYHYQQILDKVVFADLATFYFKDMLGDKQIGDIRDAVTRWNGFAMDSVESELSTIIKDDPTVQKVSTMLRKKFSLFKNLRSEKTVIRHALTYLPVLRVVENVVGPEPEDRAYGVLIIDWIVAIMINHRKARKRIYAKSEFWKSGATLEPLDPVTGVIDDFDKGTVWPSHPFAQKRVDKPGQPIEVLVTILKGYDDLELLNALGVARGMKKQACTYGAIGNLEATERFDHDKMCILQMCSEKVLTKLDPVRVFAGADPRTGEIIVDDWASPGAQFRTGAEGHVRQVGLHT